MKPITTTATMVLMATTLGLATIVPTYAQNAPAQQHSQGKGSGINFRDHNQGPRQGRGFGDFLGFERGSQAVEIALVRLSHAVDLTTEQ